MLVSIHPDNPDPRKMRQVIECLNNGGVIIYPTDTVYSIGCSLFKPKAIERVARLKGLKPEKADFSLVCYDLSTLSEYTRQVNNVTFKLMKRTLPGPFTFILNSSSQVPRLFSRKKRTVGIRIPDNNIARELVLELGHPLIATSVKDDDEILEYTTDPELIHERYGDSVDMVINAGFGNNVASTIIDCTGDEPEIIREGIGEVVL